jgi:hypothetical protein
MAVPLARQNSEGKSFRVHTLTEPSVEFGHGQANADIREGITKYGTYNESPKTIELVPFCAPALRDGIAALIERVKAGKYKYRGSERTFHTRFTYNSIFTVSQEDTLNECKRLLDEHQDWIGNKSLNRLFLIHAPEKGYAIDDERSPYYLELVAKLTFQKAMCDDGTSQQHESFMRRVACFLTHPQLSELM